MVGLNGELRKEAKKLSGGMKKRLNIAMALVGDSKVCFYRISSSELKFRFLIKSFFFRSSF
jgi:ABC-type transporter Mla maintaining outer membrane lipid asymmetry ATPase subunit MlaF